MRAWLEVFQIPATGFFCAEKIVSSIDYFKSTFLKKTTRLVYVARNISGRDVL